MRITPGTSPDIIDRRGGGGFRFGRGPQLGCGGLAILLVLSLLTGRNFFTLFDDPGATQQAPPGPGAGAVTVPAVDESPQEAQARGVVSTTLDDAQKTWAEIFQREGIQYQNAKLVLFRDITQTSCGMGQAASGPFYCPADGMVYIDLGFYDELHRRFGAPGDFAQAYVVAHEIGHHVQNLIGTADRVREAQARDSRNANQYSVALELQADCYAGLWARSAAQRNILEPGDLEEGLSAAAAVGDDRLQRMSGRAVNPDTFSHGSAEQRMEWFQRGYKAGNLRECDTFR